MPSGNIRNLRDTFLHFLQDNLTGQTVHPVRASASKPQTNSFQLGALNVTFHDATYSTSEPSTQFVTIDIVDQEELDALDIEELTVALLQQGGCTSLQDYSSGTPTPVSNSLIYWNPQSIKFRTVASTDYFHRSSVLELFIRYV